MVIAIEIDHCCSSIRTMSIDIFGRKLEKNKSSKIGRRGPPGPGFRITDDGHFNLEDKRLCNLAEREDSKDTIYLRVAQNLIKDEVQSLNEESLLMRQDIDVIIQDLEARVTALEKNFSSKARDNKISMRQVQALKKSIISNSIHVDDEL